MKNIEVGRIIEITNSDIIVEVLKKYESSHIILEGNAIRLSGVGNYIKAGSLIFQINVEKLSDVKSKEEHSRISIDKKLQCSLVGYIEGRKFKEGTNGETPDLFQKAYKLDSYEEKLIYDNGDASNSLMLGYYVMNKDIDFYLDINKMIASHILIVGNTGSGKSNTLATIYENLFNDREYQILKSESKFLIIDTNGEYTTSFSINNKMINRRILNVRGSNSNSLMIPIRSLDEYDWKVLLDATDKTQFPLIKRVVQSVRKYIFDAPQNDKRISNLINWKIRDALSAIIDSKETSSSKMSGLLRVNEYINLYLNEFARKPIVEFKVEEFIENIEINNTRIKYKNQGQYADNTDEIRKSIEKIEFVIGSIRKYSVVDFELLLNLEYLYRIYKYNIQENNISPMLSRFVSNKAIFNKIFDAFDIDRSVNYKDFEYLLFGKKPIALCDFSMAGKDIARSVVSLIASKLFDSAMEARASNENYSYHIIVDEAHNYLSRSNISKEDAIAESCIEIFEKIIKEGRKFNTFITMATQRPSEITPTLLSQAHNYIIHKLVNPNDISIISNTVPFLDSMSAKMIPILSPGQAIFSGIAFSKPNIIQIKMPGLSVKSETIKLCDIWSKP